MRTAAWTGPTRAVRSGAALLYLPDAASVRLAARSVAGRTVTVRNLVATLRAGASTIAVPSALRDRSVERALARMPALAAAVRWLEPGSRLPPGSADQPWLLVPAGSLMHTRVLRDLMMPLFLRLVANSKQTRQLYGYHIEWSTPA